VSVVERAPLLAGPAALASFWLPWFEGHGVLTGERYNGYDMLQFGAWLQSAGLEAGANVALETARVLAIGIVVAGFWLTVLAVRHDDHLLARCGGWYLSFAAVALAGASLYWEGPAVPQPGVTLLGAAAWLWASPSISRVLRRGVPRREGVSLSPGH
jgi:hypothetical protein